LCNGLERQRSCCQPISLFVEANEFKAEYEKAMEHNSPLLDKDAPVAKPEVGKKTDPELEAKVDELVSKVAETKVTTAGKPAEEAE
jgi:hypothetical protein